MSVRVARPIGNAHACSPGMPTPLLAVRILWKPETLAVGRYVFGMRMTPLPKPASRVSIA